jgi:uncharacterized membrane protein
MISVDALIFHFFVFSISGWILELSYRTWENRRIVNPGFNHGPYVPIYGLAAVVLILAHSFIATSPFYVRALVYLAVTTGLEYVTGEIILFIFKKRYWDYSQNFINLRGHICPAFSFAWVLACFIFEFLLYPASEGIMGRFTLAQIRIFNLSLMFILTVDFIYSSGLAGRTVSMGRRRGISLARRIEELPGDLETLLFNSPGWKMARKHLDLLLDEKRFRELENLLKRQHERVIEIRTLTLKRDKR